MALNFPSGPVLGQVFSADGEDFVWMGSVWAVMDASNFPYATNGEALAGIRADVAMSPLRTEQAIAARNFQPSEGYGIPVNLAGSRAEGVTYINTSGRDMLWTIDTVNDVACFMRVGPTGTLSGLDTLRLYQEPTRNSVAGTLVVPPDYRYRLNGSGVVINQWWELT